MEHPKVVGDRTTLAVMLALHDAGYRVSVPFGENTRYDLIVDDGAALGRVQCKSGRLYRGAVEFAVCSSYAHHRQPRERRRDYIGQVDAFAVYCRQTGGVYLIPIEDLPVRRLARLRHEPARNGQRKGVRDAATYRVASVTVSASSEPHASSGARGSCA